MRILFVDDDETLRQTVEHVLGERGHHVRCAGDGAEAMEILRRTPYRVVISDWQMPRMNGLELCRAVRELPGYVYVILLTCRNGPDDTVAGLAAGADDYMSKPFHPAELDLRVRAGERVLALSARNVALFSLAKLAESRDPETGAHLERVRSYCRAVMNELLRRGGQTHRRGADYVETLFQASPLHDIGKVGIPDSVLLKPGRLNDREFEIMKGHARIGAEALEAAVRQFPDADFLRVAQQIAATHHEWFDGSGYPAALRGDSIPLCGRIVALADVYDALTSKRVYKNAFNHEVSKAIILEESGTHFDPAVVEAFQAVEQEFIDIRTRFADAEVASSAA